MKDYQGCQPHLVKFQQTANFVRNSKVASLETLDESVVDYIITDLQPLSTTEKIGFRKLITALAPNRTLICPKTSWYELVNDTKSCVRNLPACSELEYHLRLHQRCVCHSMNLTATHDVATADHDSTFKKISRSTFAKCQALRNK